MQTSIVIAGGSGFLGRSLQSHFEKQGHDVCVLTRRPSYTRSDVKWDGKTLGPWCKTVENSDVLINMAGRSVDCRYSEQNKAAILDSRIESTRALHEAIASCKSPPSVWLNSSTSTIYNDTRGDLPANTEAMDNIGDDFSMNVARRWEGAFFETEHVDTVQTALRTAIVMGRDGGAFKVLNKIARLGLCSPQGPGDQWISWLHIKDFCNAVSFLIEKPMPGRVNLCAPEPIQNWEFNRLLKEAVRPWITLPQPVWLLRLGAIFMRTEAELVLKSRKVYPERLLQAGFTFEFEQARQMVADLVGGEAK